MIYARPDAEEHVRIVIGDTTIPSVPTTSPSKSFDTLPLSVGERRDTLSICIPKYLNTQYIYARVNNKEYQRLSDEVFVASEADPKANPSIDSLPVQVGKSKGRIPVLVDDNTDTLPMQVGKRKNPLPISPTANTIPTQVGKRKNPLPISPTVDPTLMQVGKRKGPTSVQVGKRKNTKSVQVGKPENTLPIKTKC